MIIKLVTSLAIASSVWLFTGEVMEQPSTSPCNSNAPIPLQVWLDNNCSSKL